MRVNIYQIRINIGRHPIKSRWLWNRFNVDIYIEEKLSIQEFHAKKYFEKNLNFTHMLVLIIFAQEFRIA